MTQIVLSIPDEKVKTFLSFINDLTYVKVEEKEFAVPEWQKKEVRKRLKNIAANPSQIIASKEALRHLKSLRV
ncbi:MAG: addiction module protein [Bacteroidota bacterium]|nr:addiction module protein [Bacteroidota bacterium]